uniref:Integrase_H2C2 domain-containing protein n=1 Tax=Syphacia muris TaxID=451379 RepID=A0A0N5B1J5_9BILA
MLSCYHRLRKRCSRERRLLKSPAEALLRCFFRKALDSKLPIFVRNRVNEVQESQLVFKHVPSNDNTAYIATKGMKLEDLVNSKLWFHGPQWLTEPRSPGRDNPIHRQQDNAMMMIHDGETKEAGIFNFSVTKTWKKTLSIGIAVRKANLYFKKKHNNSVSVGQLKQDAEIMIWKDAQRSIQPEEIERFDLQRDKNGTWRLTGRFQLQPKEKRPIFLQQQHPLVRQLIIDAHEKCDHFGTSYTLAEFRTIDKGRSYAKRILKEECYQCRYTVNKFALPRLELLPEERIKESNSFQHIALDYAGTFNVRVGEGNG